MKITVFQWNDKYLIEMEASSFKQTFKLAVDQVAGEKGVKELINDEFMEGVMDRFEDMYKSFHGRINSLQS